MINSLNIVPEDEFRGYVYFKYRKNPFYRKCNSNSPQQPFNTDIYGNSKGSCRKSGKTHIIYPYKLPSVQIYNLLVEYAFNEKKTIADLVCRKFDQTCTGYIWYLPRLSDNKAFKGIKLHLFINAKPYSCNQLLIGIISTGRHSVNKQILNDADCVTIGTKSFLSDYAA